MMMMTMKMMMVMLMMMMMMMPTFRLQDSEQKDYINVKGCVPQFEKWLQDNLTLVAGIFIGVALLQVSPPIPAADETQE